MKDWLTVHRGDAPLLVSFPHTGTDLPGNFKDRLVSPWLARKDADWWIDRLYDFAASLGATTIHTRISRTVIDVNRDPSGHSLYPGQATTELCPTTTFDGEPLYRVGSELQPAEIPQRREQFFDPYHRALEQEIGRLRAKHPKIVIYDCHSIRSVIPRLFDGELPAFQYRHQFRRKLRPAADRNCRERMRGDTIQPRRQWPASRADGLPGVTASPQTAFMPFKWNSPAAPICWSLPALLSKDNGRQFTTLTMQHRRARL